MAGKERQTPEPWSEVISKMSPAERRQFVFEHVKGMGFTLADLEQAALDMRQGTDFDSAHGRIGALLRAAAPFVWAPSERVGTIVDEVYGNGAAERVLGPEYDPDQDI